MFVVEQLRSYCKCYKFGKGQLDQDPSGNLQFVVQGRVHACVCGVRCKCACCVVREKVATSRGLVKDERVVKVHGIEGVGDEEQNKTEQGRQ